MSGSDVKEGCEGAMRRKDARGKRDSPGRGEHPKGRVPPRRAAPAGARNSAKSERGPGPRRHSPGRGRARPLRRSCRRSAGPAAERLLRQRGRGAARAAAQQPRRPRHAAAAPRPAGGRGEAGPAPLRPPRPGPAAPPPAAPAAATPAPPLPARVALLFPSPFPPLLLFLFSFTPLFCFFSLFTPLFFPSLISPLLAIPSHFPIALFPAPFPFFLPPFPFSTTCPIPPLLFAESQSRSGVKRPLRSRPPNPSATPALPSPPLSRVPKYHICTSLKYLQGCWPHHFPGQSAPVLDNPFCEELLSYILSNLPCWRLRLFYCLFFGR